jgi:hypothetical protein
MKTPTRLIIAAAAFGLVGGAFLGYHQDAVTQRLAVWLRPVAVPFFGGGVCAWCTATLWLALAWRNPKARRLGVEPSPATLIFVLASCTSTIAGGIAFFLINGMDYMTPLQVAAYAAWAGSAYNFWLVVLPLLALSALRAARRRSGRTTFLIGS